MRLGELWLAVLADTDDGWDDARHEALTELLVLTQQMG